MLRAAELGGAADEALRWNLGICATGAGDAATALRVWKELGQKLELGRFGLPEGSYPRDPTLDHAQHTLETQPVVHGKICAPPTLPARALLEALDARIVREPAVLLCAPELARAAGDVERARREAACFASLLAPTYRAGAAD